MGRPASDLAGRVEKDEQRTTQKPTRDSKMRLTTVTVMAAVLLAVVAAFGADTITTTNGEKILGEVVGFERNPSDMKKSWFVIKADGKRKYIVLDEIEGVDFGGAGGTVESNPPNQVKAEAPTDGAWWLSSSGKRHNSGCRYFKTSKGRACGAGDGVACKVCGG